MVNNSVVLCYLAGEDFANSKEVFIFLESSKLITNADKYYITHSISKTTEEKLLKKYNFHPVYINPTIHISNKSYDIAIDRTFAYYNFLINNPKYINVLLTDSGDVVFQGNPFEINHKHKAWFNSEGCLFDKSAPLNIGDQRVIKEKLDINYDLYNKQVINSSIQYGYSEYIKQSLLLTYNTLICTRQYLYDKRLYYIDNIYKYQQNKCGWVSDQGIINFLYYAFLINNSNFGLLTPDNSNLCAQLWAISEGVTVPNYDIKILENPFTIINKYTKEKYYMLHQWNRCKPPNIWEGNARPNHQELSAQILKEFTFV